MAMNLVVLEGRLTKDPETKYFQSGSQVATFTLAVDRPAREGQKKEADFFTIKSWGKSAAFVQKWCAKGKRALVRGRIEIRNYDDKEGVKHWITEITADPFGGVTPIDWPEKGEQTGQTHGEQMSDQPPAEENFYDNTGFTPSPVDPNEPGF